MRSRHAVPCHAVQGQADKEAVVQHCLAQFSTKFEFFVKHIQVRRPPAAHAVIPRATRGGQEPEGGHGPCGAPPRQSCCTTAPPIFNQTPAQTRTTSLRCNCDSGSTSTRVRNIRKVHKPASPCTWLAAQSGAFSMAVPAPRPPSQTVDTQFVGNKPTSCDTSFPPPSPQAMTASSLPCIPAFLQRMDTLFEASFSPLASSGKVLSKCGSCGRYMKLVASRPSRLYCATCEEVYNMPQVRARRPQEGVGWGVVQWVQAFGCAPCRSAGRGRVGIYRRGVELGGVVKRGASLGVTRLVDSVLEVAVVRSRLGVF